MRLDPFLAQRSADWRRLSSLLDRLAKGGPTGLSVPEIEELGRLYRRAASDLAYARAEFDDPETVSYLNQLVARGHAAIYAPARPRWGRLLRFWSEEFPRQVLVSASYCVVAATCLFGSAAAAAVVAMVSPDSASLLVPEQFAELIRGHHLPPGPHGGMPSGLEALLGSVILTNNIKVGFTAFSLGITFCAGTIYILLTNGMMLGALGGVLGRGRHALAFWSLVAPHGGIELLAICVCGGSGLLIGWALISPGDHSRRDALVLAGRRAVLLVVGAIPIFGLAALLEAFVTPAPIPAWLKVGIGAAGAAGVLAYLALAGRAGLRRRPMPVEEVSAW
jgi:uncharacterized membrane protein SpoIIM required for sporulation